MQTIVVTSGLTLSFLIVIYFIVHNGNIRLVNTILNVFTGRDRISKAKHNIYVNNYKKMFQNSSKMIAYMVVVTFILAYIFYHYLFFTVPISGSMRPTFDRGDLVLMQRYDMTPEVGDIIMFGIAKIGKDQVVTHRVYEVLPGGEFRTKGDATPIDSWTISQKQIHSKAVLVGGEPIVIKKVGYYVLDETPSSTYKGEFGFLQSILMKGKEFGLFIFAICVTLFILLSLNDSIKQKRLRRRN